RVHAQIVLCPGLNDGPHLERTLFELAPLYPGVATTAVVPVGLTRHRERLPAPRGPPPPGARAPGPQGGGGRGRGPARGRLTGLEAGALFGKVEGGQWRGLAERGSRFVFLGDEIYLLAG